MTITPVHDQLTPKAARMAAAVRGERLMQRGRQRGGRYETLALDLAARLYPEYETQRDLAAVSDSWLRVQNPQPNIPADQFVPDYKALQDASAGGYVRVAIAEMTQCLYVEGHLPSDGKPGERAFSKVWSDIWQPNRMDGRQIAVHREALAHGVAYVLAEISESVFSKKRMVRLRGVSPLNGCALWRTDGFTEFPEAFIEVREEVDPKNDLTFEVIEIQDESQIHTLHRYDAVSSEAQDEFHYVGSRAHGADVVPVVSFCNDEDLQGNVMGEIRPMIPILQRLDQDTFDRLIVQRHGSWRIRTATGIQLGKGKSDQEELRKYLRLTDLLATDQKDARFSTLDPTPLDGYIAARDADLRDFASIMQIPPHHILGLSPNVSAEGLVEAQAGLMRKMEERQHLFGESWELLMRLSAHMLGGDYEKSAEDFGAQVTWRDMESRSLAQVADALGKLAQQLEIPTELLWNRIPNWSQQDTDVALRRRAELLYEQELMALAAEEGVTPSGEPRPDGPPRSTAGTAGITPEEKARIDRMRGLQERDRNGMFD